MPANRTIEKRFVLSIIFGVLVFFGLLVFGNAQETAAALRHIHWHYLPLIFSLALSNYLIRFVRWHFYLKKCAIRLPLKQSSTVFFSGLSMSITPGKIGEVIKAYFVKTLNDTPMSGTLAVVFAERFTDLFAVVILAGFGALSFQYGKAIVIAGSIIVAGILGIILNRRLAETFIRLIARIPKLTKLSEKLFTVYEHSYRLLRPRPLAIGLLLGVAAWFSECVAFFFVLTSLNIAHTLTAAVFIYAFSTLFGAITLLPGGLVTTEGSMTGLLLLRGVPKDAAAAATIVIRVATLWFAMFFGLLWLLPYRQMLAKLEAERMPDHGTL